MYLIGKKVGKKWLKFGLATNFVTDLSLVPTKLFADLDFKPTFYYPTINFVNFEKWPYFENLNIPEG